MLNRRRHETRVFGYFAAELLVVAAAFFAAYALRLRTNDWWEHGLGPLREYLWLLPASLAIWSVLLWALNSYGKFRSRSSIFHASSSAAACLLGVLALFALLAIFKRTNVHRSLIGLFGCVAFLGLLLTRLTAKAFLIHYTQKGYDRHYVVIGGTHPEALALGRFSRGCRARSSRSGAFSRRIPPAAEGRRAAGRSWGPSAIFRRSRRGRRWTRPICCPRRGRRRATWTSSAAARRWG